MLAAPASIALAGRVPRGAPDRLLALDASSQRQ
jgi:hypothetical protein